MFRRFCSQVASALSGLVTKTQGLADNLEALLWYSRLPDSFPIFIPGPIRSIIFLLCFLAF
ncbi:hypothetical protein MPNT_20028 [Candidatus Methylacidithermus pantelleriae]|uniref:Uncharacterized protein n=1 Tax=Candidatus Methylacidithermus pantelleriae TaxID=2744239 RepID=A0A8J2BP50_9BACT|nr:hypothetical protein MPNT_20028 [Candidatus Methylacidithermus pantelleriae]